jgi:serine/threonine protein kinase
MGSVWKARHLGLDAPIAIKFQHAHRASSAAAARFRREARAAAKLCHPNVVRVVDYGIDAEVPFIAMELLQGESLKARLERQTALALEEAVEFSRQAASALDAAHDAGIVHRDLKPSNLFVVREAGREGVKLLDFGIAKWFEAEGEGITEDDLVVGSAQYMSPEQARAQPVDGRTDVWSLGVVAFQMLTGELPFHGANIPDTLSRICAGKWDPPSVHLGPSYVEVDAVFARAFELEPELRFASAGAFATALSDAVASLRPEARLTDTLTSSSGWVFGREGATLSVAVPRAPRRRSPRLLVPLALSGVALTLAALFVAGRRAPAPSALAVTPAPATSASTSALLFAGPMATPPQLASGAAAPLAAPPPQPKKSTVPAHRRMPERPRSSEPLLAREAPAPGPSAAPSHLDPVFGIVVPVPR